MDEKRARADDQGNTCKKPNVAQRKQVQHLTPAVTGLIPYGKLVKARNFLDLEEELLFRGVPLEEIPEKTTDRKEWLKVLETERLVEQGVREEDAADLKHFKKQSGAAFKLTD